MPLRHFFTGQGFVWFLLGRAVILVGAPLWFAHVLHLWSAWDMGPDELKVHNS